MTPVILQKLCTLHVIAHRITGVLDVSSLELLFVRTLKSRYFSVCINESKDLYLSATPSLYQTFSECFRAGTELFSDSINLSGVFPLYCSEYTEDPEYFGSLGEWEPEIDSWIVSGVANPPFVSKLHRCVIETFEKGVTSPSPYFRIAITPYNKTGPLRYFFQDGMRGRIIALIPPGRYGFRSYSDFFE